MGNIRKIIYALTLKIIITTIESSVLWIYIPEQETFLGQFQKQEHSRFIYMDKVQDVCWCAEVSYTNFYARK